MCIHVTKTYIHSDGARTVESTQLCPRAIGNIPCNRLERRNTEPVRIVEARPEPERNPSDGILVTEGFHGHRTRYRDVSIRSSGSSSLRRSQTLSDRSSVSIPSSASSPSFIEVKPRAPTPPPPPVAPAFLFREDLERMSASPNSPPPLPRIPQLSPPDPRRIVAPDGSAIYARPPSLELPRAANNEASRSPEPRGGYFPPDILAEVGSNDEDIDNRPGQSQRRRRPSVTIDTSLNPPSPHETSSPRRGQLFKKSILRRNSNTAGPSRNSGSSKRPVVEPAPEPTPLLRTETPARETEDERQARLERSRLAETDRRQPARDRLAREAESRERHLRETAATLERPRGSGGDNNDPPSASSIQHGIDAELAQMERERAAAAERRRESDASRRRESDAADAARRFAEDYVVRDAEGRVRYVTERTSATMPPPAPPAPPARVRRGTNDVGGDPLPSPRLARRESRNNPPVRVHQEFSPPPPTPSLGNAFRERGEEVIAREQARAERDEQARAATERLGDALGGMRVSDRYGGEDDFAVVEDYDIVIGRDGQRYRRYRRKRDGRRERPPQQFHR